MIIRKQLALLLIAALLIVAVTGCGNRSKYMTNSEADSSFVTSSSTSPNVVSPSDSQTAEVQATQPPAQPTPTSPASSKPEPTATPKPSTTVAPTKSPAPVSTFADIKESPAQACSEIHNEKKLDTVKSYLFDPRKVKVGDRIAGMTLASIQKTKEGITDPSALYLEFCGTTEVTGTYIYHKQTEYLSDVVYFYPDPSSLSKLPNIILETGEPRKSVLVFPNLSEEQKRYFSPWESKGKVTMTLTDYKLNFAHTHIWDTAQIAKITKTSRYSSAKLSDGTLLYENQAPVSWKGMQIEVLNYGVGVSPTSTLQNDLSTQLAEEKVGKGIEIAAKEKVTIGNEDLTMVTVLHNGIHKLVLLKYWNEPAVKNIRNIYSLVATYSTQADIKEVKKELLEIARTWQPFQK